MKKIHVNFLEPSQQQLNSLIKFYQAGRYVDAEKLSISITQEFPKHQFGWKVLAAVLKQNGRINESLIVSQKSVQLDPLDAEAHSNLGVILKELGRLKEAEASYRKAIILKPDFTQAHSNLGDALQRQGRLEEAEGSYRKVITLKPDLVEAYNNLGITLKKLGRLEEAEASYRQTILLKPDFAEAHYNLGITLQELERLKEAEASYKKAITLKPDFTEAHYNLSNTLKELDKLEEAEGSYRQTILLKPDYAEAHNNLGMTLKELNRLEEAEASYKKAITLKPDLVEAHYNLGKVYKTIAKHSKAVECFEKTLELNSEDLLGATLQLAILGKIKIPDKTPEKYMQEFYRKKYKNWGNFEKKKDNYRGHLLIENAFKKTHNTTKKIDILDIGCGTGSLARILRPYARTLVGIDLSPDMLFKAEEICLYDSLYKKDLSQYLGEVLNHYDMVVAAAVLIHFYDLENIFFLVRDSLRINGRFIFSIFEETQKNRDLNSFLMYTHNDDYVTALSDRLNLKIIYRQKDIHEYHKGISVPAIIYVLEKK